MIKILVLDGGTGGKDFIKKIQKKYSNIKFIQIPKNVFSVKNKKIVSKKLLKKINDISEESVFIILACHTASSYILENLIENNFIINGNYIFEPIIPMCLHIKEKKYKNILILSTQKTEKIQWHKKLLSSENMIIEYLSFPSLVNIIDNNTKDYEKSFNRFTNKKEFLKKCDCVVLGCTHYNTIKNIISKELKTKYDFKGIILDSNQILLKYFIKNT